MKRTPDICWWNVTLSLDIIFDTYIIPPSTQYYTMIIFSTIFEQFPKYLTEDKKK